MVYTQIHTDNFLGLSLSVTSHTWETGVTVGMLSIFQGWASLGPPLMMLKTRYIVWLIVSLFAERVGLNK